MTWDTEPYRWTTIEGTAVPLGLTRVANQLNLSLYAPDADQVQLLLYSDEDYETPALVIPLDPMVHKSWTSWHCRLDADLIASKSVKYYAYQVRNPGQPGTDWDKILLDPLARSSLFPTGARSRRRLPTRLQRRQGAARAPRSAPPGRAPDARTRGPAAPRGGPPDLRDARQGLHPTDLSIPAAHRGTYLGVIDKIPYLQDLGVTAIELLPVYQYDPGERNYWGYSPLNFFSPVAAYASEKDCEVAEFRQMVKALHDHGIEVFLDVVYNHTPEGDFRGPNYSFRGIANNAYYMMARDEKDYWDASGTGNSLCSAEPVVRRMILDSMRLWVTEMGVDGFRFDLATVLTRTDDGEIDESHALIYEINGEPAFANVRLISEAWDAAGGYDLGVAWPGLRWQQWNGKYRDLVRQFVKGDAGQVNELMTRIYGSSDLFPDDPVNARRAYQSVNFLTCHDGFCLYDLVSYDEKHNQANGENNQDGSDNNLSWNCGFEGDPAPDDVVALRHRQVRNFLAILLVSNGTPMFCAGDEFLNTQGGNNNPYNQDNETTWLNWSLLSKNQDNYQFFKRMIAFRKRHPSICTGRFWRSRVSWYGTQGAVDSSWDSRTLAFYLDGAAIPDDDLYVLINAYWQPLPFRIQQGQPGQWYRVVDTAAADSVRDDKDLVAIDGLDYQAQARSVVVLIRPRK